ncbi:MAG: hypothetical protein ACK4M9_17135 [Anaerobacillus sp.]|uniref:hypothetical protein n=1 Tax=Anaerobacillus sp. TaxID=1872506 RepID=UPI00391DA2D1
MRHLEDELDENFESMQKKVALTEEEHEDMIYHLSKEMDQRYSNSKKRMFPYKYYVSISVAVLLISILVIPPSAQFLTNELGLQGKVPFLSIFLGESNLDREPDFQSRLIEFHEDEERKDVLLALVNDNMSKKEREMFNLPSEWEAYRIKLDKNTKFIDENGAEITKEKFQLHDYKVNVWTKESFQPQWSKVLREDGSMELISDRIPIYSATQIQLVEMSDEEYLAVDYAYQEGEFALQVYLGEAFDDPKRSESILVEVSEVMDVTMAKLVSVGYSREPSERKEALLGINSYPVFLLYDHEKLVHMTTDLEEILNFLSATDMKVKRLVLEESNEIAIFRKAVDEATQLPGIANMASPNYRFHLEGESYSLWIDEESGTIMNNKESHTIYSLTKTSVKEINDFLKK